MRSVTAIAPRFARAWRNAFVTYSGYDHLGSTCRGGVHAEKPASMFVLVAAVKGLLAQR